MTKLRCVGCGKELLIDKSSSDAVKCPQCGQMNVPEQLSFGADKRSRLDLANEFRRMGKFDDAQREFDSLLDDEPNFTDALFGCVLNYYEVSDYNFDGTCVNKCVCGSTDKRPVAVNPDAVHMLRIEQNPMRQEQFCSLFEEVEKRRLHNIKIKDSMPHYRAILAYDYESGQSEDDCAEKANIAEVAHKLYDILSQKTDIFFPPVTLGNIPIDDRDIYLKQAIKSPAIAPMMFVVYADSFNFRKMKPTYYKNIARQCLDFAEVHAKTELVSVMSDYEPPHMMKQLSIKTIRSKSAFVGENAVESIAEIMYNMIVDGTYSNESDDDEYADALDGKTVALDEELGLSPIIQPISD